MLIKRMDTRYAVLFIGDFFSKDIEDNGAGTIKAKITLVEKAAD